MFKKKRKLKKIPKNNKPHFISILSTMRNKPKKRKLKKVRSSKIKTTNKKSLTFPKFKKLHIIIFALVLFLSGLFFFILKFKTYKVKSVSCKVETLPCARAQISIPNLIGENFSKYNFEPLKEKLKFNHPQIKEIKFKKKFPCKFDIQIILRKPKAIIEDKFQNRFFIDQDAMVFGQTTDTKNDFMIIKTEESISHGQKIVSSNIIYSLELVDYLESSLLPVRQIIVHNYENIEVILQSGKIVYFTTEKNIQKQADSLIFILENPQIDEKKKNIIDLRFENPIVK